MKRWISRCCVAIVWVCVPSVQAQPLDPARPKRLAVRDPVRRPGSSTQSVAPGRCPRVRRETSGRRQPNSFLPRSYPAQSSMRRRGPARTSGSRRCGKPLSCPTSTPDGAMGRCRPVIAESTPPRGTPSARPISTAASRASRSTRATPGSDRRRRRGDLALGGPVGGGSSVLRRSAGLGGLLCGDQPPQRP